MKDTLFSEKKTLNIRGKIYVLEHPWIMGIINLTPDSFYQGSRISDEMELLGTVEKMLEDGADIIDLGAYSSRPGATPVTEKEEMKRLLPALDQILRSFPGTLISVDTFRSRVARAAWERGASMINDISGGQLDEEMFRAIADIRLPYILMHMRGDPQTMSQNTNYANLFKEIVDFFTRQVGKLNKFGVSDIFLDPGFGFAKTVDQNYELIKNFKYFNVLGYPLLAGISRKSMVYKVLEVQPSEALNGTTVLNTLALLNQASILRVHDIREAKQIVKILDKLHQ